MPLLVSSTDDSISTGRRRRSFARGTAHCACALSPPLCLLLVFAFQRARIEKGASRDAPEKRIAARVTTCVKHSANSACMCAIGSDGTSISLSAQPLAPRPRPNILCDSSLAVCFHPDIPRLASRRSNVLQPYESHMAAIDKAQCTSLVLSDTGPIVPLS